MKFDTVGLKRDIDKYYKSFIDAFIEDGTKLLEDEANTYIAYYYSDYKPDFYERTYDFLNNSVKSYVNKNAHCGYVDLLNDIYDEHYIYGGGITDIEIRRVSWIGFHGTGGYTIPSPFQYLMEFYYGNEFRNKAISKAKKIANSNSYTYLKKK